MAGIVKFKVGSKGHGNYNTGDIIYCYELIQFEFDYALLYSPKDEHGCGCIFISKYNSRDGVYQEFSDDEEIFVNEPISWPILNQLTADKLPKVETTEIKEAIKLLKKNGYNVSKKDA